MPPRKPRAPPTKPDYSHLTIAQLQKEVAKYGFKLSTERSVLLSQLDRCWDALHPPAGPDQAGVEADEGELRSTRKAPPARKAARTEEDEHDDRRKVVELIRGDEELYLKVLRYEVSEMACVRPSVARAPTRLTSAPAPAHAADKLRGRGQPRQRGRDQDGQAKDPRDSGCASERSS